MGGADVVDPLPPEPFSAWWLIVAVALVVLAALMVAWPWLARAWRAWRRKRSGPPSALVPPTAPADLSRQEVLDRIDQIERRWNDGELTDRSAAYEIAQAVRQFTGSDASVLTLLELRSRGHLPNLTALIEQAYPVEFGVAGEGDIADLAGRARQAVSR
ncbi:MAG: hypothetical protein LBK95_11930 [Bifidobacteriaceae bacterium]|jgi:hypothetical protein|nr:hypothetical protein [Bifidobacteriaceae bacterium]